ncbi:MAG: BrnA antitoxin family protein [Beijerinckiaceae bacterium]|nr:BrnA antitoxin family protein [Beijerinckiaceae bacterium]
MNANDTEKPSSQVRFENLDDLPSAPRLSEALKNVNEAELNRRALSDPDAGSIPDGFWDHAQLVQPEGTEQITLRLPRRVLRHFKATGKGYQTRISAVLSSYVDSRINKKRF